MSKDKQNGVTLSPSGVVKSGILNRITDIRISITRSVGVFSPEYENKTEDNQELFDLIKEYRQELIGDTAFIYSIFDELQKGVELHNEQTSFIYIMEANRLFGEILKILVEDKSDSGVNELSGSVASSVAGRLNY